MRRLAAILILALTILPHASRAQSITNFVSAELSTAKREMYVGEVFEVRLTLTSHSITLGQDFSIDTIGDASIRTLSANASQYPVERRLNGDLIEEVRKYSWAAVATATGTVQLSSALELSILSRSTSLFFSHPKKTFFKIPVAGSTLSIKPLPLQGQPQDFSGAVGSFSLDVDISPREAAPGDVVKIRTEVKGTGLLTNVTSPVLGKSPQLKIYEAKQLTHPTSLIFEQQVVPQTKEALLLPELSFSFFDYKTGTYRTLRQGPFQLKLRESSSRDDARFRPDTPAEAVTQPLPTPPLSMRAASLLMAVAVLLLIIALLRMRSNRQAGMLVPAGIFVLMLIVGAVYLARVRSGYFQREVYLVGSQQKGMAAPSRASRQTMVVPPRSYVQRLASEGTWVLVKYADRYCWLPESSLEEKASD